MALLAQRKLLVLILLSTLCSGCITLGFLSDWYYLIKERDQLNTVVTWSWYGMKTQKFATFQLIEDRFETWEKLELTNVGAVFEASFYMLIFAGALTGLWLVLVLIFTFLGKWLSCCLPFHAKVLLLIANFLSFVCMTLSCFQFLGTMDALRRDQYPVYKGIPCVFVGPCFSFLGTNSQEELREWGPLHGWLAVMAGTGFALIGIIYTFLLRVPRFSQSYKLL